MIGGGDYKQLPDTMFRCRQLMRIFESNNFNLYFKDMKRMQFPRHGHSVTSIADRYILVSGSRKEVSLAAQKVELYDSHQDDWMELAMLQEGRHYHSSCNFGNKYIFVFGGIKNANK
jgi:hypothetical protein